MSLLFQPGLTEARIEELAERFRPAQPPPPAAVEDWPDLAPGPTAPSGADAAWAGAEPAAGSRVFEAAEEDFPALGSSAGHSNGSAAGRTSLNSSAAALSDMGTAAGSQPGGDEDGAAGRPDAGSVGSSRPAGSRGDAKKERQQNDEEDIDLGGPGMFDEDAAGMMNVQQPGAGQKGGIADMLAPWGGYGGPQKKKGPKLKSRHL